jgi:hypothetical protein
MLTHGYRSIYAGIPRSEDRRNPICTSTDLCIYVCLIGSEDTDSPVVVRSVRLRGTNRGFLSSTSQKTTLRGHQSRTSQVIEWPPSRAPIRRRRQWITCSTEEKKAYSKTRRPQEMLTIFAGRRCGTRSTGLHHPSCSSLHFPSSHQV